MNFRPVLPALTVAALLLGGCASSNEIDKYRTQYRVAQEQILDLQNQIEDKNRQLEVMRSAKDPNADLQGRLVSSMDEQARLEAEVARLKDQLARAQSNTNPLPVELQDELERLAQANPDLMSYDKATGMIRFRSDVTFASGQAEVRETAVPIISKLAGVLQSPVAQEYEVRVVGHTDNVPVRNAAVVQRYGDNWGLSTARAISVMKQFKSAGISEDRMSVAGYGEHQPVEANGPQGSEANRRVEVFLVPRVGSEPDSGNADAETRRGEASGSSRNASGDETRSISETGSSAPQTDRIEAPTADESDTVEAMESTTAPPAEPEESFK